MGSRTESGVVTSAGVIRGLEQFTASSGSLDSTAMAFEHLLASLARVEARFDAMERRQNVAHPPPWPDPERRHNVALPPPWPDPDPDPPFDDWQRWRGDSARNRPTMSAATAVASHPHLGFDGAQVRSNYNAPHSEEMPWDAYGPSNDGFQSNQTQKGFTGPSRSRFLPLNSETKQCDRFGAVNDGFRGRSPTAWDNPAHRWDNRGGRHVPASENDWGRREVEPYSDIQRFGQRRQDQPPPPTRPDPRPDPKPPYSDWARDRTARDNPDHSHEIHAGRQSTAWDNPWARYDGGGYSEPPRYDHYRSDRLRYATMTPPCFDGSDAVNWRSRVPVVVGDELSDNEDDLLVADNDDAEHMEEDIDGDLADIEALNYEDLDSVSKLQKTQRFTDIMQKVEDALENGSENSTLGIVLEDDPEYQLIVDCNALFVDIENGIVLIDNFIKVELDSPHPTEVEARESAVFIVARMKQLSNDAAIVPTQRPGSFDPGGEAPPKLLFAMFIRVSWFPP
ncbi:uncharacterized protein LOC121777526 [Salvia splendens]|uniref:uncharacterized protein LOC121777526 n=1 Tax=Salvia splendens TaxID=180675 RepID=UPI001C27A0AA|nr:uncharacterized protein LOC121777526 [Salvia splendens]